MQASEQQKEKMSKILQELQLYVLFSQQRTTQTVKGEGMMGTEY